MLSVLKVTFVVFTIYDGLGHRVTLRVSDRVTSTRCWVLLRRVFICSSLEHIVWRIVLLGKLDCHVVLCSVVGDGASLHVARWRQ